MLKAKPFIKWVGGKGQLLSQLNSILPDNFRAWDNCTYVEPFVGGGAMLFFILQTYPNIKRAIINDLNNDLSTCYKTVRDMPKDLISYLRDIQGEFLSSVDRREFFLLKRERYNTKDLGAVENTALFIFLNKTCFNGLYRVNKQGLFNVSFGRYESPLICDKDTLLADSEILQGVEILQGDFEKDYNTGNGNVLFYFDPPYRPISNTSCFNGFDKEPFDDRSQIRLKSFCDKVDSCGYRFLLSNSDCPDGFFNELYGDYNIGRVLASRCVNSNGSKRGKLTEIVVDNYRTKSDYWR